MYDKLELSHRGAKLNGMSYNLHKGQDASKIIASNNKTRIHLIQRYKEFVEKIKDSKPVSQKEFDEVVASIRATDVVAMNVYDILDKKANPLYDEKVSEYERISTEVGMTKDPKEKAKLHKVLETLYKDIKSTTQPNSFVPSGDVSEVVLSPSPAKPPVPQQPVQPKKGRKRQPSDAPRDIDINVIKPRVKNIIKEAFLFKNKQECLSRTKALFMSKEQIINVIDKHDDLKAIVPPNYKKLTKEALCGHLFEKID